MKFKLLFISIFFSLCLFSQSSKIISGPMLSYIDARTTQVWMLVDQSVKTIQIDLVDYDNNKTLEFTHNVENPYFFQDYIPLTIPLESLRPNTEYIMTISIDGNEYEKNFDIYTSRPYLDDTHFLIGGDISNLSSKSDDIFNSMTEMKSDFMIWTGDNLSSNSFKNKLSFKSLSNDYISTRLNSSLNNFLQSTPQIASWSNLDFPSFNSYENLKDTFYHVFDLFWPNSLKKTYNYTFMDYGLYQKYSYNDIDVFLLDTRSFREEPSSNSSLLGNNQMERLFEEINKNGATFTFIVSPTPFLLEGNESMINYSGHLNEFLNRLKTSNVEGVVLLSSQGFRTSFVKLDKSSNLIESKYWSPIYEFNLGSIAGSGPQNFSRIKVEGELDNRICIIETFNEKGEVLFFKKIHEDELKY